MRNGNANNFQAVWISRIPIFKTQNKRSKKIEGKIFPATDFPLHLSHSDYFERMLFSSFSQLPNINTLIVSSRKFYNINLITHREQKIIFNFLPLRDLRPHPKKRETALDNVKHTSKKKNSHLEQIL